MSDQQLREFERRWNETGSAEDEAAWLRERVRVGDLTRDRLRLCVLLEHEPALIARKSREPVAAPGLEEYCGAWRAIRPWEESEFEFFVQSLGRWGGECCARAGIAMAIHTLDSHWEPRLGSGPYDAVNAVGAWALSPSPELASAAGAMIQVAHDSVPPGSHDQVRLSAWLAADVARIPGRHSTDSLFGLKAKAAGEASRRALLLSSPARLKAALRSELIPWALGYSDPIRDRAEARVR